MQGNPDLLVNTQISQSVAPQVLTAAQTVHGVAVRTRDLESIVLEAHLGSLTGVPTGGTVTMIPEEGSKADGSDAAQVNSTDSVVAQFGDSFPETLRYRYIGGANGKLPYIRISIVVNLTGGTTPTIAAAGVVLSSFRYGGAQPTIGAYPDTPGATITN